MGFYKNFGHRTSMSLTIELRWPKLRLVTAIALLLLKGSYNIPIRDDASQEKSISAANRPAFSILLQLTEEAGVSLGIVVEGGAICRQPLAINLAHVSLSDSLNKLLAAVPYKWSVADGLVSIRPTRMSNLADKGLKVRFESFSSIETTMHGLGTILQGNIETRLHPSHGYAGEILSSSESELVPLFRLQNASAEQVANHIVGTGSKGVWVLQTIRTRGAPARIKLDIYSFKDDSAILKQLSCDA